MDLLRIVNDDINKIDTTPKIILEHSAYSDINIKYDVSKILKELTQINDSTLLDLRDKWNNRPIMCKEEALDVLYEIIYPKSSKQMQNR